MATITLTEALAELTTIDKRLEKKRSVVLAILARGESFRDPLERAGGSVKLIIEERQSIKDLEERKVLLRRLIQKANDANSIAVEGIARSIADWLVWKREVAEEYRGFLASIRGRIDALRSEATRKGGGLATTGADTKPGDIVVHLDERELGKEIEQLEIVLGTLDGQLSLKNATVTIDVP